MKARVWNYYRPFISGHGYINTLIIYPAVNGQSHRTIHTTWPYKILRYWYGWYWTVVIAQLSAVDFPCKVNDKSRWPRKASEWGAGSFRLTVCKQNTSVNILLIINNVITYALRIVLINFINKDIWLRALEAKQNMNNSRPMYSLSACWCPSRFDNTCISTS